MLETLIRTIKHPGNIILKLGRKGFFNWMSDDSYLKMIYRIKTGTKLDLEFPKTFNEKLQWIKINDRRHEYTKMVDKYEAKKYVASIIGESHIIPTYGVWDSVDDIDFDTLPDQFVLKCTHDSGGLIICKDKSNLDKEKAKEYINKCLRGKFFWKLREWSYKNVKPRVIAEKYMEDPSSTYGMVDYKFYCFNGEPKLLYVSRGLENHETAQISFLSLDWQFAPFRRMDYAPLSELPEKPKHYEEMIEFAKQLSKGIAFLRVDLYEILDEVYFSELTFYPCSGFMPFDDDEWDKTLGSWIKLN